MKRFCNNLSDEQLQTEVVLWRIDEEPIRFFQPIQLEEDHYIGEEDEACYPASDATEPLETLKKVYDAGHPLLAENLT